MPFTFNFFEALRRMKAAPRTGDVQPAIPRPAPAPEVTSSPPCKPAAIGAAGVALIKRFEGCARRRSDGLFEAYPDPATGGAPWTIGWGATGRDVTPGLVWTQEQCDARLGRDLTRFAADVARAIGDAPTTPAQFDALVSFHYNTGAITRATLTKLHRSGDFSGVEIEFGKWVHAGGKRLEGLVRRRAAEAALYAKGRSA